MEKLVYFNGALVTESECKVSVFDYGLLYGYGLFETMRAYSGKIFKMNTHLDRLFRSAKTIGLEIKESRNNIRSGIDLTLSVNNLYDASIRLTCTYGAGKPRLQFTEKREPNCVIMADSIPDSIMFQQEHGVRAVIFKSTRRNTHSLLSGIKSTNFLDTVLVRIEALEHNFDDAILLNSGGFVSEATTSNIFIVPGEGELITPSVDSGILPGITRDTVIEIARDIGIKVFEVSELTVSNLMASRECFLTNSVAEITPLVELDDHMIGDGKPGNTTRKLQKEYRTMVEAELIP